MIAIVDYGAGNLGSIANMFRRIEVEAEITSCPEKVQAATKLILPGVGAFDTAMTSLNESGLKDSITTKVLKESVPILGICLGMQLLTRRSEEGSLPGLGWIDAHTKRFPPLPDIKVPHMGWNRIKINKQNPLTDNLPEDPRFYFVHSYYVEVERPENSLCKSEHGITFDAVINSKNIYGAQFHPEKSHKFGMQLLRNFGAL